MTTTPIQVDLPSGWLDQTAYQYVGPTVDGIAHVVTVISDPNPGTEELEAYGQRLINQTRESLGAVEVLKEERIQPECGEAFETVLKIMMGDDVARLRRLVVVMQGKTAYTFVGDFSRKSFKIVGVQMLKIIDSFRPVVQA